MCHSQAVRVAESTGVLQVGSKDRALNKSAQEKSSPSPLAAQGNIPSLPAARKTPQGWQSSREAFSFITEGPWLPQRGLCWIAGRGLGLFLEDCSSLSGLSRVFQHHPRLGKSPKTHKKSLISSFCSPRACAAPRGSGIPHHCRPAMGSPSLGCFHTSFLQGFLLPQSVQGHSQLKSAVYPVLERRNGQLLWPVHHPGRSSSGSPWRCAWPRLPRGHKKRICSQLVLSALNLSSRSLPAKQEEGTSPWSLL